MPDYNPAVALGLHPPENSLAQTFNTIANLQLSQAHTGLYTLQAAQQARDLDAKRAYADTISRGGSLQDAAMAAVSRGGNTSDVNQLLQASSLQTELDRGGGLRASAQQEFTGANLNRARTAETQAQIGKIGIETQTAGFQRTEAGNKVAMQKASMFLANPDQPELLGDAIDAHMAANPPSSKLELNNQLRMKAQILALPQDKRIAAARGYASQDPTAEQRNATASGMNTPLEYGAAQKTAETSAAKTIDYLQGEGNKQYSSAQALLGRMVTIDHNIEALGPQWMGAGADTKANMAKVWNSTLDTLGVKENFHLDPNKIATWEEFNKEQIRAGMELINSNFGGSREAASIIQMGRTAVTGVQNSYIGAKYISSTIKAAAQRQSDLYEYQAANPKQLPAVAAIQFNKEHPPQEYAMRAITEVIPQRAKQHLAEHPDLASEFNEQFGKGTAQFVLGAR